jgi:Trk K+ transport system NAD-binding subunit
VWFTLGPGPDRFSLGPDDITRFASVIRRDHTAPVVRTIPDETFPEATLVSCFVDSRGPARRRAAIHGGNEPVGGEAEDILALPRVVCGNLENKVLQRVALSSARALILNSSDHRNAATAITARQLGYTGNILALVETPLHRQPTILAGASAACTPRHVLGAALAARASRKVSPAVSGIQNLGHKLQVSEARITPGSTLAGQTLAQARIGQETGVTVIGQWFGGRLVAPVTPEMRLEPGAILILVGSNRNIEKFTDICGGAAAFRRKGPFIITGKVGGIGRRTSNIQLSK